MSDSIVQFDANLVGNIEAKTIEQNIKIDAYHSWVMSGDYWLDAHLLEEAQKNYMQALKIYPNGKNANLGLTKVLLLTCANAGKYCQEAENYLERLKSSKKYSDIQIMEIEKL